LPGCKSGRLTSRCCHDPDPVLPLRRCGHGSALMSGSNEYNWYGSDNSSPRTGILGLWLRQRGATGSLTATTSMSCARTGATAVSRPRGSAAGWCRLARTRRSGRSSAGAERSSPSMMRAATTLRGGHEFPRHPGCRRRLAAHGGDLGHRWGRSVAVAEASYQPDGSGPGVAATAAAPAAVAPAAAAPAAEALTEYVVVDHGYPCCPHRARPIIAAIIARIGIPAGLRIRFRRGTAIRRIAERRGAPAKADEN
jgi:hypothetical protein